MRHVRVALLVASTAVFFVPSKDAEGQQQSGQASHAQVPQVVTTGRGEIDIRPDRARIDLAVDTKSATAAVAMADNAKRLRAVIDTIRKLGIEEAQIRTAAIQVSPEIVYPGQGQAPKVTGYTARTSVRVEVLRLEQTGSLVDAALARGATEISGLQFYSSKAAEARRDALAKAVEAARADAQAMARAAGYELGALIEMTAGVSNDGPIPMNMDSIRPRMAMAAAAPPPINPGEIKVVESVTARWGIR